MNLRIPKTREGSYFRRLRNPDDARKGFAGRDPAGPRGGDVHPEGGYLVKLQGRDGIAKIQVMRTCRMLTKYGGTSGCPGTFPLPLRGLYTLFQLVRKHGFTVNISTEAAHPRQHPVPTGSSGARTWEPVTTASRRFWCMACSLPRFSRRTGNNAHTAIDGA